MQTRHNRGEKQQILTLRHTFSGHTMRKKSEENRINNKDKKYLHNLKKYLEQMRQKKVRSHKADW